MKLSTLMLLLTASFLAAGCGTTPADKDLLQGAWYLVAEEEDGKATPIDQINAKSNKLIFQGEKYDLMMRKGSIEKGTFSVDSTKTPKTITLSPKEGIGDGGSREGIYDLQENVLKVCIAELNKERPTAFATKLNSGHQMQNYKRVPK